MSRPGKSETPGDGTPGSAGRAAGRKQQRVHIIQAIDEDGEIPALDDIDPEIASEADATAGETSSTTTNNKLPPTGRLSAVSEMYDINGDGVLDEAEAKMRQMDRSNRGHLRNDVVYEMLKEQIDTQRQLFNMKRIAVGLSVFTVILALSNLGTAWAAAVLSKETTVDASGGASETVEGGAAVMKTKDGRLVVGVKSVGVNYKVEQDDDPEDNGGDYDGGSNNDLFYENDAENAMRWGDGPNAGDPAIDGDDNNAEDPTIGLGGDGNNNVVEAEGLPPSRLGVPGRFTISPEQARDIWVDCQSSTTSTITRPCAFSSELGACVCGACTSFSRTGGGGDDEETTPVIYTYGEAIRVTCPPRGGGQSDGVAVAHRRRGPGDEQCEVQFAEQCGTTNAFLPGDEGGQ